MGYDIYIQARNGLEEADYYFRLNLFGMIEFRGMMERFGMVIPEYGFPEETDDDPQLPGIPAWKLGSNDGWWVHPREIKAALETYEKLGAPTPPLWSSEMIDYWRKWITYLRRAAVRGGFKVW
jgi:hypothetical protein